MGLLDELKGEAATERVRATNEAILRARGARATRSARASRTVRAFAHLLRTDGRIDSVMEKIEDVKLVRYKAAATWAVAFTFEDEDFYVERDPSHGDSIDRIHFTHRETDKQFTDKRDLGHILAERAAEGEGEYE